MDKENREQILSLKQELEKLGSSDVYTTEFMQRFGKYTGISELTRDIVASLVERILIGADKSIRIEFKFQDEMKRYLNL
jgi:hypothetical protein